MSQNELRAIIKEPIAFNFNTQNSPAENTPALTDPPADPTDIIRQDVSVPDNVEPVPVW